jgi:predicted ATPase
VWPGAIVGENTLHVHISAIRKALGPDRGMLKTRSGRGYRLLGSWTPRQISPPTDPVVFEPLRASPRPFHSNFPSATTDLIGRAAGVLHLRDFLSAYRAVTLTGPGGIGKTMLALEVARSLFPTFQGDGCLVELASLSDPGLVPTAVAGALGLRLGGDEISPEAVGRAIGDRKLLLVIDNCEHVVDAAAEMVETLLRLCPGTTVLVTSRELLEIDGEHVYRVPPLDVPLHHQVDPGDVLGRSAVQLFIARAKALGFEFLQHGDQLRAVAGICRRLDGIPLAIEFAAARATTLGIAQLASGLDDRFGLLRGGRRTAPPRHQTLRAALDWSYELLAEPERRLLCRLAVFPAGFTLDGAVAVTSDTGATGSSVADGVSNLVSKSFVTLDGSAPDGRWRLLETIRAYALEKLTESGESEHAGRRHAEFFRDLIATIASSSPQRPATEDMVRHSREIDNVRAALDWSFSAVGDSTIGIVLTAAYAPVWLHQSLVVECRERAERALDSLDPDLNLNAPLRVQLHIALGHALVFTMGGVDRSREVLGAALEIAESLDDVDAQLRALWALWALRFQLGQIRAAQSIAERLTRVALDTRELALGLVVERIVGNTLQAAGKFHEAQRCFERVLELYVVPTDQRHTILFQYDQRVLARAMLARVLWLQGFVDQAIDQAQASLEAAQATNDKLSLCWVLHYALYPVTLMTGDLTAAERAAAMVYDFASNLNAAFWRIVGQCLRGKLLIRRGEFATGSVLLRTALDTCDSTGWTIGYPELLGALAEGLAGLGQITDALATIDQALAKADRDSELWYIAELLRIKGELLLQQAQDQSIPAAEGCFQRALETARQQGALFWELRAAMSLARLWHGQARSEDARELLASIYDRFTEGFETADLNEAKVLLEQLA